MKKLLLIAVVAGGVMVAGTTRSDAQVYFSIGFRPSYYGYPYACTIDTADIVIIAIIIPMITGAKI